MNTKSRQPISENSALNRLIFRKTPAFSLLFVGNLSAPSGRPGLPTRTEYQEYNTVLTKSIQHFLNSFKFFRAAGQRKCRAPESGSAFLGMCWREAEGMRLDEWKLIPFIGRHPLSQPVRAASSPRGRATGTSCQRVAKLATPTNSEIFT